MKAQEIKIKLITIEQKLKDEIRERGPSKIEKITGFMKQDLSAFINNHRRFSWEKILKICEKIGL
jgi:hypothetical protein